MEDRKSFGAFLLQRRKELGLTQREFAERLFVTDSAVSKWERGLAYPDITLLQSICEILQVNEKELLSASKDADGRRAEQLAKRYLRLIRNNRIIQSVLYGGTLMICLIVNLSVDQTLSWFWLVLGGLAMCASLTFLPGFAPEGRRGAVTFGGFLASLLFLLAVSCLYTRGTWFPVAAIGSVFGLGLVFLPLVLRQIPLPEELRNRKVLLYVCVELVLLIALYAVSILPVERYGGLWFVSSTLWTVFGLSAFLLPFFLRRAIPLPEGWRNHKGLVYFSVESLLLLVGLVWECRDNLFSALLIALLSLALFWGWLGLVRYLPVKSLWHRVGYGFVWTSVWLEFFPFLLDRILIAGGATISRPVPLLHHGVDFTDWSGPWVVSSNINFIVLLSFLALGLACIGIGVWRQRQAEADAEKSDKPENE